MSSVWDLDVWILSGYSSRFPHYKRVSTFKPASYQFAFSAFLSVISVVALHGRRAAAGARLHQRRGERAEGWAGTGGQPRIRTVEQPFPVLSFKAIIHRL